MRIHVNLLSNEAQRRVHRIRFVRLLGWVLVILLVTDASVVGILYAGNLLLNREAARLTEVTKENEQLYEKLLEMSRSNGISIDQELATLSQLQKNYVLWTEVLLPITKQQPSEIRITSIHFVQATRTFTISGIAQSRDALIAYRNQLLSSNVIETMDAPLSSLTQKENIAFDFQGTFQPVTLP